LLTKEAVMADGLKGLLEQIRNTGCQGVDG